MPDYSWREDWVEWQDCYHCGDIFPKQGCPYVTPVDNGDGYFCSQHCIDKERELVSTLMREVLG